MIEMQLFRDENKKIGGKTIWRYDIPSGLVTNRVYANGLSVKYDYDIYGRLQCRTWARGVAADFNYDDWGAVTNICYSDATPEKNFVYDALGRLISVRDSSGCTTFSYNSKNKTSNVVYTNV